MLRFPRIFHRLLHTSQARQKLLKMTSYPDAYFRFKDGCETFDFCFYFENASLKVSRNFNFSRRVTETVAEFQGRVQANLDKTLAKKKKKKKGKDEEAEDPCVKVEFKVDGESADNDANCKELLSSSKMTMHILDSSYKIVVNAPVVTSMALPECMLAGFPVYPSKLEVEFAERKDCHFTWFRSAKPVQQDKVCDSVKFEEVASGFSYTPSAEDVGYAIKLRCEPVRGHLKGPALEFVSKGIVSAGPGHCPFHTRHSFTQDFLSGPNFRIMSYNILADCYADSDYSREVLFPYCPPYALAIDYRKQLLAKEISGYKSDLIFLQEVDCKVFDVDLEPLLSNMGYSGLFSKKGGQISEGIASFYYNKTFKLEHQEYITLSNEINENPLFESIRNAVHKNEALKSRILDRGSILQVLVLRHNVTNHIFVIGTTHLYFHPDADHVRLLQAATCLTYLQRKREEYLNSGNKCSLILCGDFNSTPPFGVYKLMTEGSIPKDYPDWKSNESEAVEDLELSHPMKISSACGCPKFTNYTVGFADCLDYIFYQNDHLRVTQVVPLPSEEELRQYDAIPSVVQPSDHVALVADLQIITLN
ncbi:2',5'-phosphodiesterase 12 [Cloeon dipterum]|uniref:2',5'-phosphodiesterase 12 n=1 Tax=Cloeon dipterum TaxID=197152 RepID=UPI00321FFC15